MLTNKSKRFLKALKKAKEGAYVSTYQMGGPYLDDATQGFINPVIQPNLQSAQLATQVNGMSNPGLIADPSLLMGQSQGQSNQDLASSLSSNWGSLIKLGLGINDISKSIKEKKRANLLRRIGDSEMNRRLENQRTEGYTLTPYTNTREYIMQQGGLVNDLDQFLDNYNGNIQAQNAKNDLFKNLYDQQYQDSRQKYKNYFRSGVQNLNDFYGSAKEAAGKVLTAMQEGGQPTPEQVDTESLYSKDFQSPWKQQEEEVIKNTPTSFMQEADEWMMKDVQDQEEQDEQFQMYMALVGDNEGSQSSQSFQSSYTPSQTSYQPTDVRESFIHETKMHESGGNPNAVNQIGATGYYQFTPSWADEIKSFMNLPKDAPKDRVMREFKKNPEAQEDFMRHVVATKYEPLYNELKDQAEQYGLGYKDVMKLIHYRGLKGAKDMITTGDFSVSKSEREKYNNPTVEEYLGKKITR